MIPKIPKTTKEEPYIEFRWNKKGKLTLSTTKFWWGGINSGFISSNGDRGNSCKYACQLTKYMDRYRKNMLKDIDNEITKLNRKRKALVCEIIKLKDIYRG